METGQQILRPTYVVDGTPMFMYCSTCGWETGWYLLDGMEWPGKAFFPRCKYDSRGAPICPIHLTRGRTRPRGGKNKRRWLEGNGLASQPQR